MSRLAMDLYLSRKNSLKKNKQTIQNFFFSNLLFRNRFWTFDFRVVIIPRNKRKRISAQFCTQSFRKFLNEKKKIRLRLWFRSYLSSGRNQFWWCTSSVMTSLSSMKNKANILTPISQEEMTEPKIGSNTKHWKTINDERHWAFGIKIFILKNQWSCREMDAININCVNKNWNFQSIEIFIQNVHQMAIECP